MVLILSKKALELSSFESWSQVELTDALYIQDILLLAFQ